MVQQITNIITERGAYREVLAKPAGNAFTGLDRAGGKLERLVPRQVPPAPADFAGREDELAALCALVEQGAAVICLRGPGGVGKTALALALAERLGERWPDGQVRLDLHNIAVEEILARVIRDFQPQEKLPADLAGLHRLYRAVMQGRRALLLLDAAQDAEQVAALLPLPPGCLALVTARARFALPRVRDFALAELPEAEAVELLAAIEPRIGAEQKIAARIAKMCGYLPLALRVVAGTIRMNPLLSPARALTRLAGKRERLTSGAAQAAASRLASQLAMDWSCDLLPEELKERWRRLGVFAGDFSPEAAAWVWGLASLRSSAKGDAAAGLLRRLHQYGLVEVTGERYRLPDLARGCAGQKMVPAEQALARLAHATYYAVMLHSSQGHETDADLAMFDHEYQEIAAAQAWVSEALNGADPASRVRPPLNGADPASRVRLPLNGAESPQAAPLANGADIKRLALCYGITEAGANLMRLRMPPRKQIRWLEDGARAARLLGWYAAESNALERLGQVCLEAGKTRRAAGYYEKLLILAQETGDRSGVEAALSRLVAGYRDLGDARRVIKYGGQVLLIARAAGDQPGEAAALDALGWAYARLGRIRRAIAYYEKGLLVARETASRKMEALALNQLGMVYAELGKAWQAAQYYAEYLPLARETGDRFGEGAALVNLSWALVKLGEVRKAIADCEQARAIFHELGKRNAEGYALGNLGTAYASLGEPSRAIEVWKQAIAIHHEAGDRRGETSARWDMGAVYLKLGDLARAVECMQPRVDYERETGQRQAEIHAAQVDKIRRNLKRKRKRF